MTSSNANLYLSSSGKKGPASGFRFRFGSSTPKGAQVPAYRLRFSAARCFAFDGGAEDRLSARTIAAELLKMQGLALYGTGPLLGLLLAVEPKLAKHVVGVVVDAKDGGAVPAGLAVLSPQALSDAVRVVFLCETAALRRMQMRKRLPAGVAVRCPDILAEATPGAAPKRAWVPHINCIYPIDVPDINIEPDLDVLLMDVPARNLALMPNGLAYVHNVMKTLDIKHQTVDADIICYHRYHIHRLLDEDGRIFLPDGREMPVDPWQAEHYDLWADLTVVTYFRPMIDEIVANIVAAKPKILGLSIQQCNETFAREIVNGVRAGHPGVIVMVGGFSCYNPDIGRKAFPECDYMCIGEADLTVGPLVQRILAGERPGDVPGVLSRFDSEGYQFRQGPMLHNLDSIDYPRYEWADISLYRNWNNYQLVPILASRGCRWSRCTFCAERFYWRIRSAKTFVDELEWLVNQGCYLFMFNESDLNGMPEKVLEICEEIIARKLPIKLAGQLRIHKKSDKHFFETLRKAGVIALRFGIDALSANTLRLQRKGYTVETIEQNLKDCWEAGIYTEVNWVIGVPGETEEDIDEGIDLILRNKQYIGRLANINTLVLANGSVYWLDPEGNDIHFREPKEQVFANHARAIPEDLWYSENPYIDGPVRRKRFSRIIKALHAGGFNIGAWASKVIDLTLEAEAHDGQQTGTAEPLAAEPGKAITQPEETAGATVADERQFQANSAVAVPVPDSALPDLALVSFDGLIYGIEPATLVAEFGKDAVKELSSGVLRPMWAETLDGRAEFISSYGHFNLVEYNGRFYACPHGLVVAWPKVDSGVYPDLIVRDSFNDLRDEVKRIMKERGTDLEAHAGEAAVYTTGASGAADTSKSSAKPIKSVGDYNVYHYEGVYYGVPKSYGEISADEKDLTVLENVIRDVSYDAVESEILQLSHGAAE